MRFTTSGALRRVDLAPVLDLLPPLRAEWADLRFGADGAVLNPLTGEPRRGPVLLEGRHRLVGARYLVTTTVDEAAPPDDPTPPASPMEYRTVVTLRRDDERRVEATVAAEDGVWTAEVGLDHARFPAVRAEGSADVRAATATLPGCLAALVKPSATARGTVDLLTLDRGGRLLDLVAHVDWFDVDLQVTVAASASSWRVDALADLRARGLARPVLWVARSRVRRLVDSAHETFWTRMPETADGMADGTADLRTVVDAAGGPETFVHRPLWDDDFDPDALLAEARQGSPPGDGPAGTGGTGPGPTVGT